MQQFPKKHKTLNTRDESFFFFTSVAALLRPSELTRSLVFGFFLKKKKTGGVLGPPACFSFLLLNSKVRV